MEMRSSESSFQSARTSQAVHNVPVKQTPRGQQYPQKACYRCGSEQHRAGDCRFIKEACHKCGKIGHIKKVCRSKVSVGTGDGARPKGKPAAVQGAHYVSQSEENMEDMDTDGVVFTLYKLDKVDVPPEKL
uniref:CCHC-type domain-containing protein n=1 Tax=Paramormyrops kingsleyae TaxID=1676925 RepID=A0A3B3SZM7_9TELE